MGRNRVILTDVYTTQTISQYKQRPRGKESTEVRKSQIKGKESENSYQELKRSQNDRHTQTHGNCIKIFLSQSKESKCL